LIIQRKGQFDNRIFFIYLKEFELKKRKKIFKVEIESRKIF